LIHTKNINNNLLFLLCLILSCNSKAANWKLELHKKIQNGTVPLWMEKQIKTDLFPFTGGISKSIFLIQNINYAYVSIVDNIIKIEWDGRQNKNETKCKILLYVLETICSAAPILNIKFMIDLSDNHYHTMHGPIFCFAKNISDNNSILLPDIYNLNIVRNDIVINNIKANITEQNIIKFAPNNLRYSDMLYYIYLLLHQYSSLQNFTPNLLS